jgi:hypothetical protein
MEARSSAGRYDLAFMEESRTMASTSRERALCILARGVALPIIAMLCACGPGDTTAPDPQVREESVDEAGHSVADIEIPGGADNVEVSEAGQLPSSFPSDVPTFPGAQPSGSLGLGGGPSVVFFSAKASPEEIRAFYSEEFEQNGWLIDRDAADENQILASKGSRTASVRTNQSSGTTEIVVLLEGG